MRRAAIAAIVVFVVAGTTAVYAQHWPGRFPGFWRSSPDDMSAFADARIAAVKAGLRLNADQEKLWPPVEAAARDLAKQRIDRFAARRDDRRGFGDQPSPDEMFERFKRRADDMTASAAGMKKLAEVAEPLYRTLNDDQKRRLVVLARPGGQRFGALRHMREGRDFDGPRDDRRFGRERDRSDRPMPQLMPQPERL